MLRSLQVTQRGLSMFLDFLCNVQLPVIFGPFSVFRTIDFKGKMTHTKGKTLYNLNNNNKKRLWKYNDIIQVLSDVGVGYRGSFLFLWFRMWVPSGMLTPPSHSYETASVFAPEKRVREGTFYLFPVILKKTNIYIFIYSYIYMKKVAGIGVNRGGERKKTEDLKNVEMR